MRVSARERGPRDVVPDGRASSNVARETRDGDKSATLRREKVFDA